MIPSLLLSEKHSRRLGDYIGLRHHEDIRSVGIVVGTILVLFWRWRTFTEDILFTPEYCFWTVLTALFCFFSATVVHNSIHVPMFGTSKNEHWKNKVWQYTLCCSYGYPVSTLIPGHNLSHHKFTQTSKDMIHTDQLQWSHNLINLILFFPTCVKNILIQDHEYLEHQRKMGKPLYYQAMREVAWLIAHQVLLGYLNFQAWLWVIFPPQAFGKFAIISMNLLQHDGCPGPEEDKYNFARNFTGTIINYFTCNNGYHTIHHMQPGLHWTEIPKAHAEKVEPYCHPACNRSNMLWYLIKTFCLNNRIAYDGTPYFPKEMPVIESWVTESLANESETYSDKNDI